MFAKFTNQFGKRTCLLLLGNLFVAASMLAIDSSKSAGYKELSRAAIPSAEQIVDCYDMKDIYKFPHKDSLVVFDIYFVLLVPLVAGDTTVLQGEAKKNLTHMWSADWSKHLKLKTGDPAAAAMINKLQSVGIKTMAHTSRPPWLEKITVDQLHSVSIDFSKHPVFETDIALEPVGNKHGFVFSGGILMTDKNIKSKDPTSKGETLVSFFDQISYKPNSVIFIDDDCQNVKDVVKTLQSKQIPVVGLWYRAYEKIYPIFGTEAFVKEKTGN
jgi:hypothetical protein